MSDPVSDGVEKSALARFWLEIGESEYLPKEELPQIDTEVVEGSQDSRDRGLTPDICQDGDTPTEESGPLRVLVFLRDREEHLTVDVEADDIPDLLSVIRDTGWLVGVLENGREGGSPCALRASEIRIILEH